MTCLLSHQRFSCRCDRLNVIGIPWQTASIHPCCWPGFGFNDRFYFGPELSPLPAWEVGLPPVPPYVIEVISISLSPSALEHHLTPSGFTASYLISFRPRTLRRSERSKKEFGVDRAGTSAREEGIYKRYTRHAREPSRCSIFSPQLAFILLPVRSKSHCDIMAAFLTFMKSQLFVTPPYPKHDFSGQTVIVTGSNVGLGLEAARHFTRLNAAKVILGVRDITKGDEARRSIEASTKRLNIVDVWQLDLSSYDSVKKFANKAQGLDRLDAVVENAGIATDKFRLCEDNESTITVNVVSTFLLALLILPKLQETATKFDLTPHLAVVSSEVHAFTSMPEKSSANIFETLSKKETARMNDRYVRISLMLPEC